MINRLLSFGKLPVSLSENHSRIQMEVELQHFSHEHPLILLLLEEVHDDDDGEAIVCNGCSHKISGSAYCCINCLFFLHKLCAELPIEMKHSLHSEHSLTLQQSPDDITFCDVCKEDIAEKHFTYCCSSCNFDVDIRCAVRAQHFSHKDPLIEEKDIYVQGVSCDACQQLIKGSVYRCTNCSLCLHKLCAEQLVEIKHPMHPEHPLTLLIDYTFRCDACYTQYSKAFAYYCSLCSFAIDISCASRAQSVKHESHKHPLSLTLSPASFECHACRTICEGVSYMCNTCSFWIHKDCASLPTTFKHSGHVHPLSLIYPIHEDYNSIWNNCRICEKQLLSGSFWFYACKGCRYSIHVNCSTKTKERKTAIKDENLDEANLIHLPMPNESVSLIDQFVKQMSLRDNKREAKVDHFSHNHPLILFDAQGDIDLCSGNELLVLNQQKNEKICNACVRQISVPFYSCKLCDFFLHKWCAELPNELKHLSHQHQLILLKKHPEPRGLFHCVGCRNYCNGFTFKCVGFQCKDYYLDVKCACLPSSIIHEAHEHPLVLRKDCITEGCAACDRSIRLLSFGCDICNFNLHYTCALLPRTIRHRYDEHSFTLIDAPIKDGPEEYICEFCEKEIDPNWWFYHCIACDKSACAKCIYKEDKEFPNIKWGSTYKFDNHKHSLISVQPTCKSPCCGYCGTDINSIIAFKCEQCDILLHTICPHP